MDEGQEGMEGGSNAVLLDAADRQNRSLGKSGACRCLGWSKKRHSVHDTSRSFCLPLCIVTGGRVGRQGVIHLLLPARLAEIPPSPALASVHRPRATAWFCPEHMAKGLMLLKWNGFISKCILFRVARSEHSSPASGRQTAFGCLLLLQLDFPCAPHGLLHLPCSYFLYFYLYICKWLLAWRDQRLLMQTWLVSLICLCGLFMLCGPVAKNQPWWEGDSCLLACLHAKLWEASLWNFSAFCLCYQTFGCLSKQGCLPIALQVIPWAHVPLRLWTTGVWLQSMDTTFCTTGISESQSIWGCKGPREIV